LIKITLLQLSVDISGLSFGSFMRRAPVNLLAPGLSSFPEGLFSSQDSVSGLIFIF